MAEQVGALLETWRTAAGWSLGQLSKRAGISKAALSQWESGLRQPRIPELEATLTALEVTQAQRALALSCIEAPRAIRQLNTVTARTALGKQPGAGDLLLALRQRGGWTQEQIAARLGVDQSSVGRWERGERLPSTEQMQALCFALEAREEELITLTTGRFADTPDAIPTEPDAVHEYRLDLLFNPFAELVDLRFLMLERHLWQRSLQEEQAGPLLATVYADHAHYLSHYKRWDEVKSLAQRAIALTPSNGPAQHYTLHAALELAAAEVHGGNRLAPERGFNRMKTWLPRSMAPEYTAETEYTSWILSDMAKYLAMTGQKETALEVGEKAIQVSPVERRMRQLDQSRLLVMVGEPGKALDALPSVTLHVFGVFAPVALIRCEAYLALGELGEASAWLEQARALIEKWNMKHLRAQSDALTQRINLRSL